MLEWVRVHPPPPGVEMYGPYPSFRSPRGVREKGKELTAEEKAREKWMGEWSAANGDLYTQFEAAKAAQAPTAAVTCASVGRDQSTSKPQR